MGRAEADRNLEIRRHAHREAREFVALRDLGEQGEVQRRFLLDGRDAHQPLDRQAALETVLPVAALEPDDGCCDDPKDAHYNPPVRLPYAARHEILWRDDGIYDVIVILGHNDGPPRPGAGSAIFLHVARDDYGPTEGCVALALPDLLTVLREAGPETRVRVEAGETPNRHDRRS